jgi:hypothetical protein
VYYRVYSFSVTEKSERVTSEGDAAARQLVTISRGGSVLAMNEYNLMLEEDEAYMENHTIEAVVDAPTDMEAIALVVKRKHGDAPKANKRFYAESIPPVYSFQGSMQLTV